MTNIQDSEIARAPKETTDPALLDMPGFVNDVVAYSMATAHRPNKVLSFAGALALLAHLAGRKYIGPHDACPNLYIIALADSGVGKNHPRVVNMHLAAMARMQVSILNNVASGQGLEDALLMTPALFCQMDEFDAILRTIKADDKAGKASSEALWQLLLSIFSESATTHITRVKAAGQNTRNQRQPIHHPSLTILANAVPENFYSSLSQRALDGGLVGRCLVFESGERGEKNLDSGITAHAVPQSIQSTLQMLAHTSPEHDDNREFADFSHVVPYGDGAQSALAEVNAQIEALYDEASENNDRMALSVWNRSDEFVGKLSLLRAISANVYNPVIGAEDIAWAWRLVKALQARMIQMAHDNAADSVIDEKLNKVLRAVRAADKKGALRGDLSRKFHIMSNDMDRIERTLVERNQISVVRDTSRNGKGVRYFTV